MDDLVIFHRHPEGPAEMPLVRVERVDHVVVSHVRCSCGSQRAVVSRVQPEEHEVIPWPYPQPGRAPGEVAS